MLIGIWSLERPTCGDVHVPATYNSQCDMTWCICGDHQWHGQLPTLHTRFVYDGPHAAAKLLGFDIYWMYPHATKADQ